MEPPTPVHNLDGRKGEGGGQLIRLAVSLSCITSTPLRITHIRGGRPKGGGLKAQHVASLRYLAAATEADVTGLEIGSQTLEFTPRLKPHEIKQRKEVTIVADTPAASAMLIFQAVLPVLLFAGKEGEKGIELTIEGGTNVSFSPSWEYLDQVLLPTLEERFGVRVERKLVRRGWSSGTVGQGSGKNGGEVWFRVCPLGVGEPLRLAIVDQKRKQENDGYTAKDFEVERVHVSILAPSDMHAGFQDALVADLEILFPGVEVVFEVVEDTGQDARVYVLVVARSATLRWGRDRLTAVGKRGKKADVIRTVSRKVCEELYGEIAARGTVDEYLQDQLVVLQALAEGSTSFPRSGVGAKSVEPAMDGLRIGTLKMKKDKTGEPFGEGSLHTTTARWVTAELLPEVEWYNKGRVCKGTGLKMETPV